MEKMALISCGAVLGANARYWVGDWASRQWGGSFPFGTFLINITGSFLLGLFLTLFTQYLGIDPRWRSLVVVGFLGSYTTFSTYAYESVNLISSGQFHLGLFNLLGSALAGGLAMFLGIWLGGLIGQPLA